MRSTERKTTLWLALLAAVLTLMVSMLANVDAVVKPDEPSRIERAITWLRNTSKMPVAKKRARDLARWFRKYGAMWKVDPWVAVAIAHQESHFRDRPPHLMITRCRTKFVDGSAVEICRKVWPGERGLMQVIPRWARKSFMACKGRSWKDPDELYDTETNICVGMHLLAARRAKIRDTMAKRRLFIVRGAKWNYQYAWKPCSWRQRKFCRGNAPLCARMWWVASWNWGSHRLYCGGRNRFDTQGYPIKVLKRYKLIVKKFGSAARPGGWPWLRSHETENLQ
jgi:hypothetical protein